MKKPKPKFRGVSDERKQIIADYIKATGCGTRVAAKKFGHSRDLILFIRKVYLDYEPPVRKCTNHPKEPDAGTYQPPAEVIRAECLKIQSTWTEAERWTRQVNKSIGEPPPVRLRHRDELAVDITANWYTTERHGRTGRSIFTYAG